MKKSYKNLSFVCLMLMTIFAFGQINVSAQDAKNLPPGSYLKTCEIIKHASAQKLIVASCKPKRENQVNVQSQIYYQYCLPNSIYNDDGNLRCSNDEAAIAADQAARKKYASDRAEKLAKSKESLNSGAIIVIGRSGEDWEISYWIDKLSKTAGEQAKINADGSIDFPDAVDVIKFDLARSENVAKRAEVINRVFMKVHGRESTAVEQATWDSQLKAQKTWYAPMVIDETKKMNGNQNARVFVINRSYQAAMGRDAAQTEFSYWLPRAENFEQIVEAHRNWLYTSGGAYDLAATVRRALIAKSGNNSKVMEKEIKEAIVNFTPKKTIYNEMIVK